MLVDRGREEGQLKVQESDTKKGEIRVQPGGRGEGFGGFGEAKKYSQR